MKFVTRADKLKYAGKIDRSKLAQVEKRVSEYIQHNFSFVTLEVQSKTERLKWESRIISTVSWCNECKPSPNWLGLHSSKEKIRKSGLWIVNELYKQPLSEKEFEEVSDLWIG